MSEEPAAPAPGTPAAPAQGAAPAAPAPGAAHAAPAAPAPFASPWADVKEGVFKIGEGDAAKPWWGGIQEEPIKEFMEAKQYATPDEAARGAWNANRMLNMQPAVQAVLEGKATPEQEAAFLNALGRPESPDKYEFKPVEGVENHPDIEKLGKEIFYEAGLSPKRAEVLYGKWQEGIKNMTQAQAQAEVTANDAALVDLDKRWGGQANEYKAAGMRALNALKGKGLSDELMSNVESKLGSAGVAELLAVIGKATGEAGFIGSGSQADPNDPNTMSKEQAAAKITQLQSDDAFQKKYTDAKHPDHAGAVELMQKLFAKAG